MHAPADDAPAEDDEENKGRRVMKLDVTTLDCQEGRQGRLICRMSVFGLEPRRDLLHRMVTYQLAKRRQRGTHYRPRTRNEVIGHRIHGECSATRKVDRPGPPW